MSRGNLTYDVKTIRVSNAVVAGTTDIECTILDLLGADAVRFIALLGALTATQVTSLVIEHGDTANLSDPSDVTGSGTVAMADAHSNKMLISDLLRPTKRYCRAVVERHTANAVIDGVIAEVYYLRSAPATADASVSAQAIVGN